MPRTLLLFPINMGKPLLQLKQAASSMVVTCPLEEIKARSITNEVKVVKFQESISQSSLCVLGGRTLTASTLEIKLSRTDSHNPYISSISST